jgi:hypothetical protein
VRNESAAAQIDPFEKGAELGAAHRYAALLLGHPRQLEAAALEPFVEQAEPARRSASRGT